MAGGKEAKNGEAKEVVALATIVVAGVGGEAEALATAVMAGVGGEAEALATAVSAGLSGEVEAEVLVGVARGRTSGLQRIAMGVGSAGRKTSGGRRKAAPALHAVQAPAAEGLVVGKTKLALAARPTTEEER